MLYRGMMIFPVFAFLLTMTACTGLRSFEGSSPEETMTAGTDFRSPKLSKNDLWSLTDTLEKERVACQRRLVDQKEAIAQMNIRLSDQQNETILVNKKIAELNHTMDDLSTKMKQLEASSRPDSINWGMIMHVKGKTNIRAERSIKSRLRGYLMPGQPVRADFLKDDWYAVFKIAETVRSEKNALGYVDARLLFKTGLPETAAEAREKGGPPAEEKPAQDIFSVAVKSIRHKVLPEGKEVLFVEFDRFYVPAVYNIEGDAPRIIMDVTCTSSMKKEWSEIRTDGTLIRKIRVKLNPTAEILRIVLDMTPDRDYDIKPTFFTGKGGEVYTLEVTGVTSK